MKLFLSLLFGLIPLGFVCLVVAWLAGTWFYPPLQPFANEINAFFRPFVLPVVNAAKGLFNALISHLPSLRGVLDTLRNLFGSLMSSIDRSV